MILPLILSLIPAGAAPAAPLHTLAQDDHDHGQGPLVLEKTPYDLLLEEYREAVEVWEVRRKNAEGTPEFRKVNRAHPAIDFLPRFRALEPQGYGRSLLWVIEEYRHFLHLDRHERLALKREVYATILESYLEADWLGEALYQLGWYDYRALGPLDTEAMLADALERVDAEHENRAALMYWLGKLLITWSTEYPKSYGTRQAEGLALFERLMEEHARTHWAHDAFREHFQLTNLRLGAAPPDFDVKTIDGEPIRLSDHRGKIVVVTFWGFWNPEASAEVPVYRHLTESLAGEPFQLIGINTDEDQALYRRQRAEQKLTWLDGFLGTPNSPLTGLWGVDKYPKTFVLDADGVLRGIGLRSNQLTEKVERLVEELKAKQQGGDGDGGEAGGS